MRLSLRRIDRNCDTWREACWPVELNARGMEGQCGDLARLVAAADHRDPALQRWYYGTGQSRGESHLAPYSLTAISNVCCGAEKSSPWSGRRLLPLPETGMSSMRGGAVATKTRLVSGSRRDGVLRIEFGFNSAFCWHVETCPAKLASKLHVPHHYVQVAHFGVSKFGLGDVSSSRIVSP